MSSTAGWVRAERGNALWTRLMIGLALRGGWPVGRAVLPLVTLYFLLTGTAARRASRRYLGRALGRPASTRDVARHFHCFAHATLDRIFLLAGATRHYRIETSGLDVLDATLAQGRGCILLGAHLGSFEALRTLGRRAPWTVRPLMYRRNLGAPSRLLEALDLGMSARVIEIGKPDTMLRVRESLAAGEIVGMLGDRAPQGEKTTRVDFLGSSAAFPTGPLLVASILGAPVVLFHGVRVGARHYRIGLEAFADSIALRRPSRAEDLRSWVQLYATRLETLCRNHPTNWFNFYDFWEGSC